MLASIILNLLNGGPIIFYYDFGRTFGLTSGLASAPFMWILGPTALAFHLPGVLYYSLYIWTTYLIAKTLIPRTAYLVLILMFFTPYVVTEMTVHNWPHTLVAFLGNLIFLLFFKLKSTERNNSQIIFLLFFTMGLAHVYTVGGYGVLDLVEDAGYLGVQIIYFIAIVFILNVFITFLHIFNNI